jgi:hypothetical protein
MAYQQKGKIFYRTFTTIAAGTEPLLWYTLIDWGFQLQEWLNKGNELLNSMREKQ